MCSVNDDDCEIGTETPIISKTIDLNDTKCKKCEEKETAIVLRGKDAYCKNCFLASSTHKFRATLGKSKIVRPNDKILVAHSGRAASSILLHLIRAGMQESTHKRLVFKSTVLYIDEGILEGKTLDQRRESVNKISDQIKNFGFNGFFTTINESLTELMPKISPIDSTIINDENEEIKKIFASLNDESAKKDLLLKLRSRLLHRVALQLNCNKIFTAESATSLSISILNNISMGRGAHLSLDVGFIDTRYSDTMILRPMRGFTTMEIDYYSQFHNVEIPIVKLKNFNDKNKLKSIQNLISQFVNEMDAESHGTVSTVLRTGEKLCTLISKEKNEKFCILCNATLDTELNNSEICAIQATNYSQFVSTNVIELNGGKNYESLIKKIESNCEKKVTDKNCESKETKIIKENDKKVEENSEIEENNCNRDCECKKNCTEKTEDDVKILKKNLCYGCQLIVVNFKDVNDIPIFMINNARNSMSFRKMHEEIAEFLL